jgi:hypothetical protein
LGGGIYMDHVFETELEDVIQETMEAHGLATNNNDITVETGWFMQLWKEHTKLMYAGDGNDVAMPPLTLQDNIQVILHEYVTFVRVHCPSFMHLAAKSDEIAVRTLTNQLRVVRISAMLSTARSAALSMSFKRCIAEALRRVSMLVYVNLSFAHPSNALKSKC